MNTKGSRNDGLNNLALTILITVFGIKLLARVFCLVVFCFVSFFIVSPNSSVILIPTETDLL